MLVPTTLYITLCLEACSYFNAKVVEAGDHECICINEDGEFDVYINYYYPDSADKVEERGCH